ncbi:MAG TPA: hypothetical protein VEA69_16900 [Tepidisphaeraceae bacterium]|nr:hypothetical protein [Tepidisphaeraceae bacterium]
MPDENLNTIIARAIKDAGFSGEFHVDVVVNFDTPPLTFPNPAAEERYMAAVTGVPGVTYDDGQGNGYSFGVDPDEFTLKSERQLLKVLSRFHPKGQ